MDHPAPKFSLPDQHGNIRSLNDFAGKWIVLYFYPRNNTPRCSTEACSFRDARNAIEQIGNCTIIGISKDSVKSHRRFVDKYSLNFTLLSDQSTETIQAYGAWQKKRFMGRDYMGIERMTVIIDPTGKIVKSYSKVDPKKHALEIIHDLIQLQKN